MSAFEHSEKLTSIFGEWPSFHDAEVLRFALDRSGAEGPTLEAEVHLFAVTSDVDATGHHILKNHTRVTLRFTEVAVCDLEGFNHQNVLFSLTTSNLDPATNEGRRLQVELSASYGLSATFQCKRAIVSEAKVHVI
jgi:hypothetical protein